MFVPRIFLLALVIAVVFALLLLSGSRPRRSAPLPEQRTLARTRYAVTNQRILVVVLGRQREVQTYTRAEVGKIVRVEGDHGWGTLIFGQPCPPQPVTRFVNIPHVRDVESLLVKTFKQLAPDSGGRPGVEHDGGLWVPDRQ
jgi:hypothetical protein